MGTKRINDYRCTECEFIEDRYWDVDDKVGPRCSECGGSTERMLAAPKIVDGVTTLRRRTPDGFKDIVKHIDKVTPSHFKGKAPSVI